MQTNSKLTRRSAAGIIVPKPRSSASTSQNRFSAIRNMLDGCGSNRNDKAVVAIVALISEGVDTGPRIVAALQELGFDSRHAGLILRKGTGNQPDRHWWLKDDVGKYALLS